MFQAPKLTDAGKALYYENMGGKPLKITTIQMGSGTLSAPIARMTALVTPVVTINAAVTNNSDQYLDVSGKFSNAELAQGFYWREIGVFAADPDYPDDRSHDILYCYQNAYDTADFIPVASIETVEKNITVPIIVGDAATVTCTLSKSLIYATSKDLEDHNRSEDAHDGALYPKNEKSTPTDEDDIAISDSTDNGKKKRLTWANIKAALGKVFAALEHTHPIKDIIGLVEKFAEIEQAMSDKAAKAEVLQQRKGYLTQEQFDTIEVETSMAAQVSGATTGTPEPGNFYTLLRQWFGENYCTDLMIDINSEKFKLFGRNVTNGAIKPWTPIATATPPQEYDLPLAAGYTAQSPCKYSKAQDNRVYVGVDAKTSGAIASATTIATLPAGYRPAYHVIASVTCLGSTMVVGTLDAFPDGRVAVYHRSSDITWVSGQISFLAS